MSSYRALQPRTVRSHLVLLGASCLLATLPTAWLNAEDKPAPTEKTEKASSPADAEEEKKLPEWEKVIKGFERRDGLLPLYFNEKEQKLLMEINRNQYEKEFIFPISVARGAGTMVLGGDTLNFGDQWILSFRRVADRILVIRKNVYFKAASGSPQADAVKTSYNDSVIAALNVKSEQGGGQQVLVDLAELLMTDLPNMGLHPDTSRSTWGKIKAFPENIEIQANVVTTLPYYYAWFADGPDVPDMRGAQIVVHYGLSLVPEESSYTPRLADDRVGHFLSVVKDYSNDLDQTAFQRYVTRWKLEKSQEGEAKSPPKQPIIFWIEKTVPREYRPYVKAGILEWNKAFEKIGFLDAIQVRDQQAGDDFEPEDIRYNTFRWITTSAAFAMGPSRTNPKTGQILDADIVFDESMVRYWRSDYLEVAGIPQGMDLLLRGHRQAWFKMHAADVPLLAQMQPELLRQIKDYQSRPHAQAKPLEQRNPREWHRHALCTDTCRIGAGMSRQMGLMAAVFNAQGKAPGGKIPEEYIGQAIKEVVMHEVGHTLGLRHNFKASTMLSLKDASNPEITQVKGIAGSVMDYLPANFAAKGEKQGDYFSTTIGPYDYWAIEYAYAPIKGDEAEELKKIASKLAEPGHDFGTDEDLWLSPDPRINAYDLGDPLDFAKSRIRFVNENLEDLAERVVEKGDGWQRARIAFNHLLGEIAQATYLAAQYIGSEYSHRDHRDDPNGRLPYVAIPIEKQREALAFVKENIFAEKALKISPELLNKLAPEQFSHWGLYYYGRDPMPLLDEIFYIQQIALSRLMDGQTLSKIQNAELRLPPGSEMVRMPEIFDTLTSSIWSELPGAEEKELSGRKVQISTIRRNLQREHFKRLTELTLGPKQDMYSYFYDYFFDYSSPAPPDARSLARYHLKSLRGRIDKTLTSPAELDSYSRAHLDELRDQMDKVLAAAIEVNEP